MDNVNAAQKSLARLEQDKLAIAQLHWSKAKYNIFQDSALWGKDFEIYMTPVSVKLLEFPKLNADIVYFCYLFKTDTFKMLFVVFELGWVGGYIFVYS